MKKFILTIACAFIAFSAFAKVDDYLTIGFGYRFQKSIKDGSANPESSIDLFTITDQLFFESNIGMFWNLKAGVTTCSNFTKSPNWLTDCTAKVFFDTAFDTGFAVRFPTAGNSFFSFGAGLFVNTSNAYYYGKGINPDVAGATEKSAGGYFTSVDIGPMLQLSYILMPNDRLVIKFDISGKYSLCNVAVSQLSYSKDSNLDDTKSCNVNVYDTSSFCTFSIEPSISLGIKF